MFFEKWIKFITLLVLVSFQWSSLEARDIKMTTVDWPPYYGAEMEDNGVITVIVKAAFEKVGHNASIKFMPWKRALKETKEGIYDVAMGGYHTEERAKTYLFSDPFYDIDVGFVALKTAGITNYSKLEDLKKYKIGISRGWANSKEFDEADFLNKEEATNQIINIRKLFKKRIDMLTIAFGIFRYEVSKMKEHSVDDVAFVQPPLSKNSLYLLVSRAKSDHAKIAEDFNKGLKTIKEDGSYDKILKKYGF